MLPIGETIADDDARANRGLKRDQTARPIGIEARRKLSRGERAVIPLQSSRILRRSRAPVITGNLRRRVIAFPFKSTQRGQAIPRDSTGDHFSAMIRSRYAAVPSPRRIATLGTTALLAREICYQRPSAHSAIERVLRSALKPPLFTF